MIGHQDSWHWLLFGTLAVMLAGCGGDELSFHHVSGKVTFDGKPVVYGTIDFVPDTSKGNKGPATTAEIKDGVYDTSHGSRGVLGGAYQVRITAYEQQPVSTGEDETKPSTSTPPFFVGYSMDAADLTGPKDFDVPASAKGFGLGSGVPVRRANDP